MEQRRWCSNVLFIKSPILFLESSVPWLCPARRQDCKKEKKNLPEVLVLFWGVCVCQRDRQMDRQNVRELDAQRDLQSLCQRYQEFKEETRRPSPVLSRFPICELATALACCRVRRASSPSFSSLFPLLGIPVAFFTAQCAARGGTGASQERSPRTMLLCVDSGLGAALAEPRHFRALRARETWPAHPLCCSPH